MNRRALLAGLLSLPALPVAAAFAKSPQSAALGPQIAANAVTTSCIGGRAVTRDELVCGSINASKIQAGSICINKIRVDDDGNIVTSYVTKYSDGRSSVMEHTSRKSARVFSHL